MVRQLYEDIPDKLVDGVHLVRDGLVDTVHLVRDGLADIVHGVRNGLSNVDDVVRDTYRGLKDLPQIQIRQDECNTIVRINASFPGSNLSINYRNPYCELPHHPPPFEPDNYADCGRLFLHIAFGFIRLGYIDDPQTGTRAIEIPAGVNTVVSKWMECHPGYATKEEVLNVAGGGGRGAVFYVGEAVIETLYREPIYVNHNCAEIRPPLGRYHYPVYIIYQRHYTVSAAAPTGTISELFSRITTSSLKPELISLESDSRKRACRYPPEILPPPPPPPPMSCCPNTQETDQMLRLILKRIGEPKEVVIFDEDLARKGAQKAKKKPESLNEYLQLAVERTEIISRIVGIENFPITVPDTMIEPHKEGIFGKIFGFIDGKKKRKINTIAELITWMSEQDSAVLGQFHQVIDFETGGKDKKGKAEKATVVLPNVAETLKEIIILTSQMALQNNVQTELIFKIASEVVAARAAAHKSAVIAADIQDYLDYPTETKSAEITTNVNFPRVTQNKKGQFEVTSANEDYKEFLKAGSVKFSYDDWTGDTSLRDQLMDLLQVASALRASMMQRIDK